MKKVLLTFAALAFVAGSAFAQFEQGTILLSGSTNLGFMANSTTVEVDGEEGEGDAAKSSQFGLGTKAGYFFADGIAGGLMLSFDSASADVSDGEGGTDKATSSTFMVGPWVRYYMEMGLFAELNAGFGSVNDGNDDTENASLFGFGLGVGYAIMLGDRVALEPSLGYSLNTATTDFDGVEVKEKTGSFGLNVGVTVFLGN